jgi:hypothetical protein
LSQRLKTVIAKLGREYIQSAELAIYFMGRWAGKILYEIVL